MSIRLISDFFAGFGKYGTTFARFLGYGAILAGGVAAKIGIVDPVVSDIRAACVERGCPVEEIEQTELKANNMVKSGAELLIKRFFGDKLPEADDGGVFDTSCQEGQP